MCFNKKRFADGTEKYIYSNGEEETLYFDGTIQKIDENKTKTIFYANGQKVYYINICEITLYIINFFYIKRM